MYQYILFLYHMDVSDCVFSEHKYGSNTYDISAFKAYAREWKIFNLDMLRDGNSFFALRLGNQLRLYDLMIVAPS